MALSKGDTAPAFSLPEKPGSVVDVGARFGDEPVVLLFFPLAYSPHCVTEMCTLRDQWAGWGDLDAEVYAISVDNPFVTDKFRQENALPFPVLSDFNKQVAADYDVLYEEFFGMHGVAKRSAFVVDTDGKIAYAWSSDDPADQPDFAAVRAAVVAANG